MVALEQQHISSYEPVDWIKWNQFELHGKLSLLRVVTTLPYLCVLKSHSWQQPIKKGNLNRKKLDLSLCHSSFFLAISFPVSAGDMIWVTRALPPGQFCHCNSLALSLFNVAPRKFWMGQQDLFPPSLPPCPHPFPSWAMELSKVVDFLSRFIT